MQTDAAVFLTPDDLAKMLKISERTLWRLLSAHKIPEPVRIGGSTRWRLAEVQEWIAGGALAPLLATIISTERASQWHRSIVPRTGKTASSSG